MNERIRELQIQAKAESSQWLGSKPATTITYDELEKFAELIVRECVHTVQNRGGMCGALASNWIKEHFRVEE